MPFSTAANKLIIPSREPGFNAGLSGFDYTRFNKLSHLLYCNERLNSLLAGLSEEWIMSNEGKDTWSPYEVIGHMINGEKTDWIPRANIILSANTNKNFEPFNHFAQTKESHGKTMIQLLQEFEQLRKSNLTTLKTLNLAEPGLLNEGVHPEFGKVNLKELLSTWVAHDLNHISQVCRSMAKQYKGEVGPWVQYLGILNK